ncbi:MAG: lactate utilization protein [Casimicrobiaceae bacterium]
MADALANNRAARDAILGRVCAALGKSGDRSAAEADAEAYLARHDQGPRPRVEGDLVEHFLLRARDMASTVERVDAVAEVPAAVHRYLAALRLPAALATHQSTAGVCWAEFGGLDWTAVGLTMESRPTLGDDRIGVTGCFCAVAETGTLVMTTGADTPTATTLLPDTHVAVVRARRIVAGMEDAFALVRKERPTMPRAINFISGPSRTGDIEQTIVLGAHGPFRLHIIVVG